MYDDDEDDELEMYEPGAESLYTSEELCQFVFETLEKKHPVKITEIEYNYGGFDFSVSADLTRRMPLPNCWQLKSFGNGCINFHLTLEDFQALYTKLEERTFKDSVRVALERVYGKVCDVVSIEDALQPVYEGAVDVVVRLKAGCRFDNWFPVQWVEGDLICFQVDYDNYRDLTESDEYRNFLR